MPRHTGLSGSDPGKKCGQFGMFGAQASKGGTGHTAARLLRAGSRGPSWLPESDGTQSCTSRGNMQGF